MKDIILKVKFGFRKWWRSLISIVYFDFKVIQSIINLLVMSNMKLRRNDFLCKLAFEVQYMYKYHNHKVNSSKRNDCEMFYLKSKLH